jgi:fermentation-respiration switch protein FrsA (DUF1100 family)
VDVRTPHTDRQWAVVAIVGIVVLDLGWLAVTSPAEWTSAQAMDRIVLAWFCGLPLLAGAVIGGLAALALLAGARLGRPLARFWALVGGVGAAIMFMLTVMPTSFVTSFDTVRATLPWVSGMAFLGSLAVLHLLDRDRPLHTDRQDVMR